MLVFTIDAEAGEKRNEANRLVQSSINEEDGLGVTSLSVLYAAIMVSCMFVPTWLISKLGCKWTIVCCQLCYSAYIGAQFYPTFGTLIPGAIILGLGAAPMWSAKCTYLTQVTLFFLDSTLGVCGLSLCVAQVGNRYSQLSGEKTPEPCVSRFFGVFFMIFQTSSIWGNLISSLGTVHCLFFFVLEPLSIPWCSQP